MLVMKEWCKFQSMRVAGKTRSENEQIVENAASDSW